MAKPHEEWLKQADYDMDTAECMFDGGRYTYAVFLCHQSIEKAFKGLYHLRLDKVPPKTHNLVRLTNDIGVDLPIGFDTRIARLNEARMVTRYPDSLERAQAQYNKSVARSMLDENKAVLQWIRTLLST